MKVDAFFARTVGAFGANFLSAGLTFGLHILLARVLGGAEYGVYAYVLTWIVVIALIAKLGFDTALVRYIPDYCRSAQWGFFAGLIWKSRIMCGGLAGFVSVGTFVVLFSISMDLSSSIWWSIAFGLFVLPLLVDTHLAQAILRGLKEVPKNELPDRVIRPAVMLLLVAAGSVLHLDFTAPRIMGIHFVGLLVAYGTCLYWVEQALPTATRSVPKTYNTKRWLTTALPLAGVAGMHLALANIDIIMLGGIAGTTSAGIYSVSSRIAVFVIFALTAVNAIAAPVIAEQFKSDTHTNLRHLLTLTAWLNLAFALLTSLTLGLAGHTILGWFGVEFRDGYAPLIILCVGHVLNAACGSVGAVMAMTGHERAMATILMFSLIINSVANFILIPIWGMMGAAVATSGTTIFWNILMLFFTWRTIGINPSVIPLYRKSTAPQ